ncbi:SIS domain-containing protein [Erwinia sp. S38]|uniref:SIS domain-containing protein n=1 Tax=Erwinia sp. S38 TaxID=2769338 RepID=UPI00190D2EE7|nr:SIS domain-containing protein [Erwinia sp. S38]MBK0003545.1 SIS domain-containing protein [Erwinia sp. S38]
MQTQTIIASLMSSHFQTTPLRQIFLVACGGSLVDMYPSHYFLSEQSDILRSWMMTANEFVYATPKALGASSLVIVCSHGGNTPESVAAAKLAKARGAATVTLTHNAEAQLLQWADHNLLYQWGDDTPVTDNPMALILSLCVDVLRQVEDYAGWQDFQQGFTQIDAVIRQGRTQVADRCTDFADRYQHDSLFYVLSSGASYGHAYGFAICSLMEMQRVDAASIHSGEFFHGPFEVTDNHVPFILLMNEGRTRELDQRALSFLNRYNDKTVVVDARELGLNALPASVVDYFNPVLFYSIMCDYRAALADIRQHPLSTRRYMGVVDY